MKEKFGPEIYTQMYGSGPRAEELREKQRLYNKEHEKGESKLKEKKEHLAEKIRGKFREKWTEGHKVGSMSYLGRK